MDFGVLTLFVEIVVFCLLLAIVSKWRKFRLWHLFAMIALVACFIALGRFIMQEAIYTAVRSSYGGRRFTRGEAESIRGENLDILPDSEFLEGR